MTWWSGIVAVDYGHYVLGQPTTSFSPSQTHGLLPCPGGLIVTTPWAEGDLEVEVQFGMNSVESDLGLPVLASERFTSTDEFDVRTWDFGQARPPSPPLGGPGSWQAYLQVAPGSGGRHPQKHVLRLKALDESAKAWAIGSSNVTAGQVATTRAPSTQIVSVSKGAYAFVADGPIFFENEGPGEREIHPTSPFSLTVETAGPGEWVIENATHRRPRLGSKWRVAGKIEVPPNVSVRLESSIDAPTSLNSPVAVGPKVIHLMVRNAAADKSGSLTLHPGTVASGGLTDLWVQISPT